VLPALSSLLLALAAIVLLAALARALFVRLGLPGVAGEILLGVALGPSLLGWAAPGLHDALFPSSNQAVMDMLSWVGLALFVFQVGLEMRWTPGNGRRVAGLATGGLLVPLVAGTALPMLAPAWFFATRAEGAVPPAADLLVGIALTVSALPVLARILEDIGRARDPFGSLVLAAATVDDVVGWLLLAVVSLALTGTGFGAALGGFTVAAVAAVLLVVAARLAYRRLHALKPSQATLVGALALAFAAGALTHWAGLNAVLGPLAVGAALSQHPALRDDLDERLRNVTRVLLLPIFFVASGAAVDLTHLGAGALLVPLLVTACVATGAKLLGCGLGARAAGLSGRESWAAGSLLSARGAVGLVVVRVGKDVGVLSDAGYGMLVLTVALTTLASPLLARLALGKPIAADASPP